MRLNKEDWEKLDELLGKHGFGGYYDMLEALKMCLNSLGISYLGIDPNDIKNLSEAVSLLNVWTYSISQDKEFLKLLERVVDAHKNKKN